MSAPSPTLASGLINLDNPGHFVHFGVIQISYANLTVILLMILVFVLALVLPFPHGKAEK
jgi:hypothetical protein